MPKEEEKMKYNFFLEEYRQVYAQFRHTDNIDHSKEAIFAIAAFGILALVVRYDFSIGAAIGAAFVSVSLFLYHVIQGERIGFYTEKARQRLKQIEKVINREMAEDCICYQTKIEEYEKKTREKKRKWFGIRSMRRVMLGILITLWYLLISIKIWYFICDKI